MPYSQSTDLPEGVKNALSEDAQVIYLNAFNGAWDDYDDSEDQDDESREEAAHNAAWAAVKESYDSGSSNKWDINQAGTPALIGLALLVFSLAGTFLYLRSKSTKFE